MNRAYLAFSITMSAFLADGVSGAALAQEYPARSPRNAGYTIDVRLDPAQKTLAAREVVTWRNDREVPAGELWFHLYWNAWKNNRSTWLKESRVRGFERAVREEDWSYCDVKSMKVLANAPFAAADLRAGLRYASPDDHNVDDQTVMVATLPRPVGPKETIQIEVVWDSKIPRTFSRTGFRGNFFFIAQWFPKLGVYEQDGTWNCHQFHAGTEFFSDYGIYDVRMTVPRGWKVGATGKLETASDNPDGTTTHRHVQADVHDFAWTTSPDYREARREFSQPGLKQVSMRLLYQPEHEGQVPRHFRATEAALRYYGAWFGEYPYGHITIIDPAYGSGAGGMEYPTLFTCGTRYFNPEGSGSPEGVTVHEAGHQFWFAMVGNNEFEDAWLDEGFNTFSTERAMAEEYGESCYTERFFRGFFFPVMIRDIRNHRMTQEQGIDRYRQAARSDVQATPTYLYHPATGGMISYNKTALWLSILERTLGWDMLQKVMSTFFNRWKFRHPKPEDFFAVANEVIGHDMTWFFDEVYRKAAVFDYCIDSVASTRISPEGFSDGKGRPVFARASGTEQALYETRVVVRRLQDGVLPVDVLLKFENGEEARDVWDGKSPWRLYRVVMPVKLEYAVVDPGRKILLDVNYTNNSRRLAPASSFAASKWASKWMFWLQDYLQTLSFLM